MPLSEHEQRLLDQIERALYQEDPKFASTVKSTDLRTHMRRRLRRAAFVLVLGFAILLAGLITLEDPARTAVGMIGFVVMVGALLLAMTAWKRLQPGAPDLHVVDGPDRPARPRAAGRSGKSRPSGGSSSGGMKDKLEERWKRRWEERGGDR
ncbi:MAG: putative rane protein [Frankiales bacterium]|nr:putative rane protein [Frankiales bacterium]